MKIAILNQPLANRGDEAAHRAFINTLIKAFPSNQVDVIFLGEKQELIDALKVGGANYLNIAGSKNILIKMELVSFILNDIKWGRLLPLINKFWKILKNYDSIICAPGGICLGGFKNWNHLYQLSVAKYLNKPIYYWARSIGPFLERDYSHKLFKINSLKVLKYFKYISLRDMKSMNIAKELGIKAEGTLDSAFLEVPNIEMPITIKNILRKEQYIVFVPNQLTWHFRYKNINQDKIDSFYNLLMERIVKVYPSYNIVMLPQTYMSSINDYSYFKNLQIKSRITNLIIIPEDYNSDIQQKIISGSKLVIGARYHSIVFAINNHIPFVALSYENKIVGLLENLNLTERCVEIQDIFDTGNENLFNKALNKSFNLLENINYKNNNNASEIVAKSFINLSNLLSEECCR